ncbi:MAG: hypothetical protein K2M42_04820 [Oscillospiraceae bacterium]|nr:hypothetical protein [Oscillospiraceae bacterium]
MKKEQVLNLMNTVGPDLIEEADIQAPAKRRMPKAVRTGLIAACLCLALLGTAFAANPEAVADFLSRFTPVQAETCTTEDGVNRYYASYTPIRYPMDSFSPALLAAGEGRGDNRHVELSFDTWAEVRAFIGEDIPCFYPETGGRQFVVTLHYNEDKLIRVGVHRDYATSPWVWLDIYTEHFLGSTDGSTGFGMTVESESGDSAQVEMLEPYPMANGCQAEIALFTLPADPGDPGENVQCVATFVQDGIQYQVQTGGWFKEEQLAKLYEALDLFP